ncbi:MULTISPECIES: hypothetical protein [unclassified Brevundimonas]|uniref:hypothetical protein n=1 Tax=unclassified Brevundimonas TaxID=2622653 RepID=UPI0025BE6A86|nr:MULTISPECIES: hypothetical protein [unclassified Brevundimonas]
MPPGLEQRDLTLVWRKDATSSPNRLFPSLELDLIAEAISGVIVMFVGVETGRSTRALADTEAL